MVNKPLIWVGSSRADLRAFPDDARHKAGYQLRRVQIGEMPSDWKPLTTVGRGVYEIRVHTALEYRILYVARFEEAVYVLHAFEKRTRKAPSLDLAVAKRRLAEVERQRKSR